MSREVKRIKAENPEVDHRRAFRMAAGNWARSPTGCQRHLTESGTTQISADQRSMSSVGESNEVSPPQLPESSRVNSASSINLWNGGMTTTKGELQSDFEEFDDQ